MYLEFGPAAGAAELVHHLLVLVVIARLRQALPAKAARPDGSWREGKGTWRDQGGLQETTPRAGRRSLHCRAGPLFPRGPAPDSPPREHGTHRLGQKTPPPSTCQSGLLDLVGSGAADRAEETQLAVPVFVGKHVEVLAQRLAPHARVDSGVFLQRPRARGLLGRVADRPQIFPPPPLPSTPTPRDPPWKATASQPEGAGPGGSQALADADNPQGPPQRACSPLSAAHTFL